MAYYLAQVVLLCVLAFTIGPNLWLYRSPFHPGNESVMTTVVQLTPMVAAIKAY